MFIHLLKYLNIVILSDDYTLRELYISIFELSPVILRIFSTRYNVSCTLLYW